MNKTKYPSNIELAELLRDIAAVYQIKDEAKYRFQKVAYERAADGIEKLSSEVKDYFDANNLQEIPGVGKSIADHLNELFKTGKSTHFEEMLSKYPRSLFTLMKVPGIGPKKAYRLVTELKISEKNTLQDVLDEAKRDSISKMEGFGEESQKDIVEGINEYLVKPPERVLISEATDISEKYIEYLKEIPQVVKIDTLGSLRRRASTVGDIDLSVATDDPKAVFDRFVSFPMVTRVIERGEHSSSVLLPQNIQVDLMIQPKDQYGSLLQHFTGSKHHNVALREYSLKKNMSLSEYGIKDTKTGKVSKFSDEKDFYAHLGLSYIPPEIREGRGEIEAAEKKQIPKLIELSDVKGDLQIHSDFDIETSHDVGDSSMESICKKAIGLGYEYIAFTEHNPSQKGHTESGVIELLKKKSEKIKRLNSSFVKSVKDKRVFKVFNSLEVDILPSGNLAITDKALEELDFALVSLHSSFKQSKEESTKRVLSALAHPKVKIFAHPTGRLLNKREGVNLDWDKIFDFVLKNNKWIEINADPHRLDLPDVLVKDAVNLGVKLTLGTDSHHEEGLLNMKYGVFVARRGWASKKDIMNTRSLSEFESVLLK